MSESELRLQNRSHDCGIFLIPPPLPSLLFFPLRMKCYKCITDALQGLLGKISEARPAANEPAGVNSTPEKQLEYTLSKVLISDDELAHVAIFEWFCDNKLQHKLIEVGGKGGMQGGRMNSQGSRAMGTGWSLVGADYVCVPTQQRKSRFLENFLRRTTEVAARRHDYKSHREVCVGLQSGQHACPLLSSLLPFVHRE